MWDVLAQTVDFSFTPAVTSVLVIFAIVEWLDVDPQSVSFVSSSWLVSEDKKLGSYLCPSCTDESVIEKCSDPRSD